MRREIGILQRAGALLNMVLYKKCIDHKLAGLIEQQQLECKFNFLTKTKSKSRFVSLNLNSIFTRQTNREARHLFAAVSRHFVTTLLYLTLHSNSK